MTLMTFFDKNSRQLYEQNLSWALHITIFRGIFLLIFLIMMVKIGQWNGCTVLWAIGSFRSADRLCHLELGFPTVLCHDIIIFFHANGMHYWMNVTFL